jgi:hypothetical protein
LLVKIPNFRVYAHPCDVRCCYVNGPLRKRECAEVGLSYRMVDKFVVCLAVDFGAHEIHRFMVIYDHEPDAMRACTEVMDYINAVIKEQRAEEDRVPGDEWKDAWKEGDDADPVA